MGTYISVTSNFRFCRRHNNYEKEITLYCLIAVNVAERSTVMRNHLAENIVSFHLQSSVISKTENDIFCGKPLKENIILKTTLPWIEFNL